jgi:peptide/nickel transport system permease protein
MTQFLIRRIFWAIFLFFVATIITYVIFWVIPADPAQLAAGRSATPADIARVRHFLRLDEPIWKQYARFVWQLVRHGDLGRSFVNRESVRTIIAKDAPVTASLVFGGAVLWLALSIPIGILSALRPRSIMDRITMSFVLIGISAHPVWIGLIFAYVFGYQLHLTPIAGYCNFFPGTVGAQCEGPVNWAYHMILPWVTFMILFAALYVRLIRANVMETMNEDYVRTARAKGASQQRVMVQHVLRNSMLPVVTILGMDLGLRARRRDLHRGHLQPARPRPRDRPGVQPDRPADDHRDRRLRDAVRDRLQLHRRPRVRVPRPAHQTDLNRPSTAAAA